jgi:serralysin
MSNIEKVLATGAKFVDDLLTPTKWAGATISYAFSSTSSVYGSNYGLGETSKGFAALNAKQQAAAKDAFKAWSEVASVTFVQTNAADAEIRLASSSAPNTAWAYTPSDGAHGGDVWIGSAGFNANPVLGNYAHMTILHEIGHALGLGHPHDAKLTGGKGAIIEAVADEILCPCCAGGLHGQLASGQAVTTAASTALQALDAMAYSVMSYNSFVGADKSKGYSNEANGYAQSPMARDIAAIQHLYGANYQTQAGDTVYRWSEKTGEKFVNGVGQGAPGANRIFETVWDGGGRDTFDFSAFKSNLSIDINPGAWSNLNSGQTASLGAGKSAPGNVAVAYLFEGDARAYIENVVGGAGNDTISGNATSNVLIGGAGNDTIKGIAGNNVLVGGNLTTELSLIGINAKDLITLSLAAVAKDGDDTLLGGQNNDVLIPGSGKNVVNGGAGSDTLVLNFDLDAITITGDLTANFTITYDGGSVQATSIEFLALADGIYSLGGPIGSLGDREYADDIALLYRAGLGRELDVGGLSYWLSAIESGNDMDKMALSLIDSAEFAQRFGNPEAMASTDFVDVLYENVLGRDAATGETQYWVERMDAGTSQSHVLIAFAQSAENRAGYTAGSAIDSGDADLVAITHAQWASLWA